MKTTTSHQAITRRTISLIAALISLAHRPTAEA